MLDFESKPFERFCQKDPKNDISNCLNVTKVSSVTLCLSPCIEGACMSDYMDRQKLLIFPFSPQLSIRKAMYVCIFISFVTIINTDYHNSCIYARRFVSLIPQIIIMIALHNMVCLKSDCDHNL